MTKTQHIQSQILTDDQVFFASIVNVLNSIKDNDTQEFFISLISHIDSESLDKLEHLIWVENLERKNEEKNFYDN